MPEMHFRQPGFTWSGGTFTKQTKTEYKSLKKQKIHDIFIKTNVIKLDFNMAYGDFKDLLGRTPSDKIFRDKAFDIAKNSKYDGY